jgi:hypothetical protein
VVVWGANIYFSRFSRLRAFSSFHVKMSMCIACVRLPFVRTMCKYVMVEGRGVGGKS